MNWREAEADFESPVLGRETLSRAFEASAERNGNRIAQRYKGGVYDRSLVAGGVLDAAPDGEYADLGYARMRDLVRRLAAGFRELGVGADDRVGLLSHTRMEWALCDFGLLAAGAVVSTVYTSSSERQVSYLLSDPRAAGVVVEGAAELRRVLAVEDDLDLEFVVVVDALADGSGMAGVVRDRDDVYDLADVHDLGREAFDESTYRSWLDERDPDDLASLVYTSGTTGRPKGVRLTHGNFKANVDQCYRRFGPRPDKGDTPVIGPRSVTLSFLPLAHVFERLAGHFMMFAAGATVAYAESPDTLREDFALVEPTTGTSVPRVYERLYDAVRAQAADSAVSERIFEWAADVGRTYQRSDDPGPLLTAKRRVADRLVFSKVRDALGGRVDFLISGGGSLSPELCELYHGMGLPILEGYGLTETSPVIAVNPPERPQIGTVGPPVVDADVDLDTSIDAAGGPKFGGDVGELLVRGPNVADGYWNRPEESEAAFADGSANGASEASAGGSGADRWFRTGDVVEIRPDGYVAFRERAKQILVLSTGKNVAPGPVEDAFAPSDLIDQAMVLGDGQKFVSALLVPDFEGVRAWAAREGIDLPADARDVCRDDRVRERIDEEVERVNEEFEAHERVKRYRLVPEEFTEDNDLLTPTMKKKRRSILDRYADEVNMLYEGDGGAGGSRGDGDDRETTAH